MTDVREIPEAIQWHEGMLLVPQHFQQLALRHEALVHYHAYTTAPFYWGVRRLTIDQALLVSGTLRVLELEAIMPDGLIVTHGLRHGRGESALEIDLTPYAHEMTHKPLPVHLAVAAGTQGAVAANGALTRYASIEDALNVELHFKHIDDFDPVSVLKQVEPLRKLFEALSVASSERASGINSPCLISTWVH
jgi:type VI secretion system protein ImpJ